MQGLTRQQFKEVFNKAFALAEGKGTYSSTSIRFVTKDLVAEVLHVRSDLMRPPGMQCQRKNRKPVKIFSHSKVCNRSFPILSF